MRVYGSGSVLGVGAYGVWECVWGDVVVVEHYLFQLALDSPWYHSTPLIPLRNKG